MPLVAGNKKVNAGKLGAFKKPIVWLMRRDRERVTRFNERGNGTQGRKRLLYTIRADCAELRASERKCVLVEDGF